MEAGDIHPILFLFAVAAGACYPSLDCTNSALGGIENEEIIEHSDLKNLARKTGPNRFEFTACLECA